MIEQGREGELRGDRALGPCLVVWSTGRQSGTYPPPPAPSSSRTSCGGSLMTLHARLRLPLADELRHVEAAARQAPDLWQTWVQWFTVLHAGGRTAEGEAVLTEGVSRVRHPLSRVVLLAQLVRARLLRGDTAGAGVLRDVLAAAVSRDGRPGIRWAFLELAGAGVRGDAWPEMRTGLIERIRLARAHGAWAREAYDLATLGGLMIDRGDPARAFQYFERQIAIADRVGAPRLQLLGYMRRGRAYSKLGRLREAERDLLHAIAVGAAADSPWDFAEAYHNLAHTYEGAGRWADAARAADRFIELTRPTGFGSLRMMSLHDAGLIRWKAGWHAAARVNFAAMVQVIDEIGQDHYWAGEYYERIGDLPRAVEYYRRGVRSGAGIPDAKSLAGLARVFEALGYGDSAELAARRHDSTVMTWAPTDVPLLPGLLARRERFDDAVDIAQRWTAARLAGGNVHGAAVASLQVADLLLRQEDPNGALIEATRAESLALRLKLTDELIQARQRTGTALVRLGRQAAGLVALREAASLARAHPTVDAVLGTEQALGDALAAAGEIGEALAAYDRAARAVERVTARLEVDWHRAGYRDRHLAPFDGAVKALLRQPASRGTLEALAGWSQRRKGAALALASATGVLAGEWQPAGGSLAQLQARLGADEALVDYLVVDSIVAALVLTPREAHVVRLPASSERVRQTVDRLRRPLVQTYAGRVDLARAPFDLAAAGELHRRLVQPLAPLLASIHRLAIAPDDALHSLPFEALLISPPPADGAGSAYGRARFLIDEYEIAYLSSARALVDGDSRDDRFAGHSRVLALEWEVPGGREEVEAIRRVWPGGRVTVLQDAAATETAARTASEGYAVLHLAAHAEANGADPLASHLRLAPDGKQDGYYHLAEVALERRPPPLVVLSACETLSGRLYGGEGLMALARAFLTSGARHVVATQWPVGAASADLMERFYRRLAAGDPPPRALRAAKLELRAAPPTAHPFFWAGFELVTRG
jgi:CHAT domain-containing protein